MSFTLESAIATETDGFLMTQNSDTTEPKSLSQNGFVMMLPLFLIVTMGSGNLEGTPTPLLSRPQT